MSIEHIVHEECRKLESRYPGLSLSFLLHGEVKGWGDLRYYFFEARPRNWDNSYGTYPVYGCYAKSNIICAIEDINNGKIEGWLRALKSSLHVANNFDFHNFSLNGMEPLVSKPRNLNLFDLCFQVSTYLKGNVELIEEFLQWGQAIQFPIEPFNPYSTETTALFIPTKGLAYYRVWWVETVETREISCTSIEDLVTKIQSQETKTARNPSDVCSVNEQLWDYVNSKMFGSSKHHILGVGQDSGKVFEAKSHNPNLNPLDPRSTSD